MGSQSTWPRLPWAPRVPAGCRRVSSCLPPSWGLPPPALGSSAEASSLGSLTEGNSSPGGLCSRSKN